MRIYHELTRLQTKTCHNFRAFKIGTRKCVNAGNEYRNSKDSNDCGRRFASFSATIERQARGLIDRSAGNLNLRYPPAEQLHSRYDQRTRAGVRPRAELRLETETLLSSESSRT